MRNQSRIGTKYQKLSTGAKLAVIASRKRAYDNAFVAANTGYSETHVCNVLHGRHENSRIVNFAYNMSRSRARNK